MCTAKHCLPLWKTAKEEARLIPQRYRQSRQINCGWGNTAVFDFRASPSKLACREAISLPQAGTGFGQRERILRTPLPSQFICFFSLWGTGFSHGKNADFMGLSGGKKNSIFRFFYRPHRSQRQKNFAMWNSCFPADILPREVSRGFKTKTKGSTPARSAPLPEAGNFSPVF